MDNQKKKTNTKQRRHTSSSWEKKSQGIKDSVKSKIAQNSKPATTTSVNSQTSANSSTPTNIQDTSKPAEKPTTANTQNASTEKTTPPADTSKAKKSSIWDKTPKPVKWTGKTIFKGGVPAISDMALNRMNKTSSLYYDPKTGMYVNTADMQPIWQKNAVKDSNIFSQGTHYLFDTAPKLSGEAISDLAGVEDPTYRNLVSTGVDLGAYVIPVYGVGKGIYDAESKLVNSVLDTNRDIDMIKDLRYGDLGYSNKWLLEDERSPIWEGTKSLFANDYMAEVADLLPWTKGDIRRTGFSEQSDVYKLGQQTITKMMHKMLEDTNNFDPANKNSRATLNKFNMMNQLLKNSDRYWELQSIKKDKNMSDESFYNYLNGAGIDTNTYRGMEYAAKQLYNLGDNQERNGLRYDNSIISTQAPMLQYKYARKQKPIADDPLGNLVGGTHILDGYHKVGDKFINTKPKKEPEPIAEVKEEKKDNTPQKDASNNTINANSATITETTNSDLTPEYLTNFYKEFDKKYNYDPAKGRFNIWL